MKNLRNDLPSKLDIILYWKYYLIKKYRKFKSEKNITEDTCFACGCIKGTERCHIKAYSEGGSNDVENLHLLCKDCHKESEYFFGESYVFWFNNKNTYIEIKKYNEFIHEKTNNIGKKLLEYNFNMVDEFNIVKFVTGDWTIFNKCDVISKKNISLFNKITYNNKNESDLEKLYNLIFATIKDSYISHLAVRIKNGMKKANNEGRVIGRRKGFKMDDEYLLNKYKDLSEDIKKGTSLNKCMSKYDVSKNTVIKIKRISLQNN